MSDKGGKLIALGGIAALIAHFWPRGGNTGQQTLTWWPQFGGGGGGDTPAGEVDISIIGETAEDENALNTPIYRDPQLPRGIRNSNPGNIEHGDPWQGRSEQQTDSRFIQFDAPEYGIRAMARTLSNYGRLYGIDTVQGVIERWAPSRENNVNAYVASVAAESGIDPAQRIDLTDDDTLARLIPAMIRHENGRQPYSEQTIRQGIRLA